MKRLLAVLALASMASLAAAADLPHDRYRLNAGDSEQDMLVQSYGD